MIDGIIKYGFDFKKSSPLDKSSFEEIEKIRKRLFALGLIGVTNNGIGYGNISQRVGKNRFVITGTQTGHLSDLNENHYSLVEECDDENFYLKSSGAIKPSSEALTHGTIYNLSNQIKAVIHIHSTPIWNFMLNQNYLKTTKVEYGSIEMIKDINKIFSQIDPLTNQKFVMTGHQDGVIIFGKTLQNAELTLYEIIKNMLNPTFRTFFKTSYL